MAFWVHYLVPSGAGGEALRVSDDEALVFGEELSAGGTDQIVEFCVFTEGDGLRIGTDINATAVMRGNAEAIAAAEAADGWILDHASQAIRIHELLLYRWFDTCSERHRTSIPALSRWLKAHDPAGDYWKLLSAKQA